MISRKQAIHIVLENISPLKILESPLEESLGRRLERDMVAGANLPDRDRSTRDGFAVRSKDLCHASPTRPASLKIIDEIHPSTDTLPPLKAGEAVAILTGGPIPPGADAVIMQEQVHASDDRVLLDHFVSPGQHISKKGEAIGKGDLIARQGTVITPVLFSALAGLRIKSVPTRQRPSAAILAIGNELVDLHDEQTRGKIVASNLFLLTALMASLGADVAFSRVTANNEDAIQKALMDGLNADIIITTGGTGRGRSDFTRKVMEAIPVDLKFSGFSMAPGKGTLFGLLGEKPLFALPGTPAAVLAVFHVLIRPAIEKLAGSPVIEQPGVHAVLEKDISTRSGMEHCVQGVITQKEGECRVRPLVGPEKSSLSAITDANGFFIVPRDRTYLQKGQSVSVQVTRMIPSTSSETPLKKVPCVSIVGKSDAGKTTLIEKLIPALKQKGYGIGTIKHNLHGCTIDHEGKDSWRHKQAGAATVVISSPATVAVIRDSMGETPLPQLVETYFQDRDIVLAEGFKREQVPKVEIFRKAVHTAPLCLEDNNLVAIVTDAALDLKVPTFSPDDITGLAYFLEKMFLRK